MLYDTLHIATLQRQRMDEKLRELESLAYKNRYSIYYQPGECLVRTYFKDGTQHKEIAESLVGAVDQMILFLINQRN